MRAGLLQIGQSSTEWARRAGHNTDTDGGGDGDGHLGNAHVRGGGGVCRSMLSSP